MNVDVEQVDDDDDGNDYGCDDFSGDADDDRDDYHYSDFWW